MMVRITTRPFATVPAATTRIFGPGQVCLDASDGDVVLVQSSGLVARGIRFFERLRVHKSYAWTNHACVVRDGGPNAWIIQETDRGSVRTALADLGAEVYTVTHLTKPNPTQMRCGLAFLDATVGTGYGWLSIPADAFNAVTGLELALGLGNRMVCSTQTCRFLERLGLIPDRSPYAVTPAHLAWYFDVPDPLLEG